MRKLRTDAESMLRQRPVTVTDKEFISPGATRHDYRSLGSYWWPNPHKEDGLPYVRRDGKRNPEIEDPRHADRSRLRVLDDAAGTLSLAYHFDRDPRYAEHAAKMLRTFFLDAETRMNPNLRYAQAIPGRNDGRYIGLIDTRELFRLLDAAELLKTSDAWSDEDHQALAAWLAQFTDWLVTHDFGAKEAAHHNNHGTWYDVQIATYAKFLGREKLLRTSLERARGRITKHIQPDGRQPHELKRTKTFSYSVMNLEGFFLLARLGEAADVDLWHHADQRLRVGLDYLIDNALDREWPHEQITPPRLERMLPLLAEAGRVYDDPRYRRLAAELIEKHPDSRAILLYDFADAIPAE